MKGMVLSLIDAQQGAAGGGVVADACELIIQHTSDRLSASMQPFFDKMHETALHMGSSLDYLLRIGTQSTASSDDLCTNFHTNPYVVAIIPEPVDYFRACGLTSVCRCVYAVDEKHTDPEAADISFAGRGAGRRSKPSRPQTPTPPSSPQTTLCGRSRRSSSSSTREPSPP